MLTRTPLPFQGNKSQYRKIILDILETYIPIAMKEKEFYIVDVFGGSGFCAYLARQVFHDMPNVHVVYNDYDNYVDRLMKVDQTNRILQKCLAIIRTPHMKKMSDNEKEACLEVISQESNPDFITLSNYFLFSPHCYDNWDGFKKESFYNKLPKCNIDVDVDAYLEGIDVIHAEYEEVIDYFIEKPTLFILDPPYLYSDKSAYNTNYWRLDKYMLLLRMIMDMNHIILFSEQNSELSFIIESLDRYFGIQVLNDDAKSSFL